MNKDVIKNILKRFLESLSKRLKNAYDVDLKFSVYGVDYYQSLDGDYYLHVFVDTEPIERNSHNKKFIKDEIKQFLKDGLMVSDIKGIVVFIDERPLYNIDEEKLPFKEKKSKNTRIREFSQDVNSGELKWHVDEEDRMVKSLHETDWMVQIDDQLPQKLNENKEIFIPKGVYHRVIKGTGNLKVKVRFI